MERHTEALWQLVYKLFTEEEQIRLQELLRNKIPNVKAIIVFDESLDGPSITRLNCHNTGRYAVDDRDIFRPLQYCGMYFKAMNSEENIDDPLWLTRDIVEMSSLHIESLIKNIGNILRFPLGRALQEAVVKRKVDPETWRQIDSFVHVYNDAKHNFSHPKDTHMFSVEDAILSYFVCRKLGLKLYPIARLATDIKIFETECSESPSPFRGKLEGGSSHAP